MWIEIFKTGTWTSSQGKTRTYTKDDLDKIVSKFDPNQKPPVTVGHPEKDTAPAYGWMKALKRVGDVLMGDFDFIPEFLELLKKGVYKNRSIGLIDGAICHVAFLGGVAPAVKGLKDIEFSADEAEAEYYESTLEKENGMEKEIQEKLDRLEKLEKDFAAQSESVTKLQKELDAAKTENAKMETEKREAEVDAFCDSLVKNGQLTPAVADSVKATMHGLCADEKNFEKGGVVEQLKETYSKLPKLEHLESNKANKQSAKKETQEEAPSYYGMPVDTDALARYERAKEIQKEEKISYSEAVKKAIREG